MEFNFGGVSLSLISSLYIKENNFVKKVWKLVQIIKKKFFLSHFAMARQILNVTEEIKIDLGIKVGVWNFNISYFGKNEGEIICSTALQFT